MKITIEIHTGAENMRTTNEVYQKIRELVDGLPEDPNYGGDKSFDEWPPCEWSVLNDDGKSGNPYMPRGGKSYHQVGTIKIERDQSDPYCDVPIE